MTMQTYAQAGAAPRMTAYVAPKGLIAGAQKKAKPKPQQPKRGK